MNSRILATIVVILAHPGLAFGQLPKGKALLRDALLTNASRGGDVKIRRRGEVASKDMLKPPVRITYVVKTDSTNIRLGYAADQIIFNWEQDKAQLRIDGGPAAGRHVHGAGGIPLNKFVTIIQEVTPQRMTVSVNGVERASWKADFSKVDEQVRVFTAGANLTIRSIHAEQLK